MAFLTLFLIAIGLTFDTFAVSISTGVIANSIRFPQATRVALVLALFQAVMPLIGWLIGTQVESLIGDYDHWIAFGLLSVIGIKMIIESLKKVEHRKDLNPFKKPAVLLGMALATSIDALIVGISFAFLDVNILLSMGVIFFTTYVVAMLGMLFGKNAGKWFGRKVEILGGLILILIGGNILFEHII